MNEPTLLIPVWNDWACLNRLLQETGRELAEQERQVRVLVVDDGSGHSWNPAADWPASIREVVRIRLACNLGHQRAIAVGLVEAIGDALGPIVVMDSDGEDKPADVARLLEALEEEPQKDVVFAGRLQRSESWSFRAGYTFYRLVHWILTGVPVRFGNFSAIRVQAVRQLVWHPSLWNHYAAAVVRARLAYGTVATARGSRYEGRSRLSLSQLVAHGLGALSVFADTIVSRVLLGATGVTVLLAGGAVYLVSVGEISPAWAVGVSILGALALAGTGLAALTVISQRSFPGFVPARDGGSFVAEKEKVHPRGSCP